MNIDSVETLSLQNVVDNSSAKVRCRNAQLNANFVKENRGYYLFSFKILQYEFLTNGKFLSFKL